ncbi:hypothetical protein EDC14_1004186 [Hydrogenispora ethanolica]|uniref:Uncharacterized protein n=1 Tax=Hydrogenispora ethanolica TaxID=1082276 RepID=A0A4R1S4U4_HYDET|nr:hypothetical protein [Hydrogenispora ethanolica]TCL74248.1 hypothetical protein EDC14_1004186 [Hydrogenispora ethanolica]
MQTYPGSLQGVPSFLHHPGISQDLSEAAGQWPERAWSAPIEAPVRKAGVKFKTPAEYVVILSPVPGLTRDLTQFTRDLSGRAWSVSVISTLSRGIDKSGEVAEPLGATTGVPPVVGRAPSSDLLQLALEGFVAHTIHREAAELALAATLFGADSGLFGTAPSNTGIIATGESSTVRRNRQSFGAVNPVTGINRVNWSGSGEFSLRIYRGLSRWQRRYESITDPIFPLMPNWRDGITEQIEYLTDIITSYDETEQRIRVRDEPRRSFEYMFTAMNRAEMALLESTIWKHQGSELWLPLWTDARFTTHAIPDGGTQARVETGAWLELQEDGYVVLYQDPVHWEIKRVTIIYDSAVFFLVPVQKTWPQGTLVIPVARAVPSEKITGQKATAGLLEAPVRFELVVNPDA